MNDINLVSGRSLDIEKQAKRLKLLRIFAILSLLIVALVSIFFFIFTVSLPINSVKQNEQQTLSNISGLHKRLASYVLIKDRLTSIQSLIQKRTNYPQVVNTIISMVDPQLTVQSFDIEAGSITITITGGSLTPINQFINDMLNLANNGKLIKNLSIQSLSFSGAVNKYTLVMQSDLL